MGEPADAPPTAPARAPPQTELAFWQGDADPGNYVAIAKKRKIVPLNLGKEAVLVTKFIRGWIQRFSKMKSESRMSAEFLAAPYVVLVAFDESLDPEVDNSVAPA